MPLILEHHEISKINGPRHISCLKSKKIHDDRYIILFGETHSIYENYCFDNKCYDIQLDFIDVLNKFAKFVKTSFYLEQFITDSVYLHETRPDIEAKILADQKLYSELHHKKKKTIKESSRLSALGRSSMMDLSHMYESCFYKNYNHLCPYKNIKWQYSDIREKQYYFKDSNRPIGSRKPTPSLLDIGIVYATRKMAEIFEVSKDDTNTDTIKFNKNNISNLYEIFYVGNLSWSDYPSLTIDKYISLADIIFNNNNELVDLIMNFYPVQKQYNKLPGIYKRIFTNKSFQYMIQRYDEKYNVLSSSHTIDKMINFLYLSKEYLDYEHYRYNSKIIKQIDALTKSLKKATTPEQKENILMEISELEQDEDYIRFHLHPMKINRREEIVRLINELEITHEDFHKFLIVIIAKTSVTLDIYFILRMYSSDDQLTLSYFGSEHCISVANYLCNIVKICSLDYEYVYPVIQTTNDYEKVNEVIISKTIDLNKYFLGDNYVLPYPRMEDSALVEYKPIKSHSKSKSSSKRRASTSNIYNKITNKRKSSRSGTIKKRSRTIKKRQTI